MIIRTSYWETESEHWSAPVVACLTSDLPSGRRVSPSAGCQLFECREDVRLLHALLFPAKKPVTRTDLFLFGQHKIDKKSQIFIVWFSSLKIHVHVVILLGTVGSFSVATFLAWNSVLITYPPPNPRLVYPLIMKLKKIFFFYFQNCTVHLLTFWKFRQTEECKARYSRPVSVLLLLSSFFFFFYCPTSPLSPFLSQSEWRPLSLPLPPSLPSFSPQSFCLFALTWSGAEIPLRFCEWQTH